MKSQPQPFSRALEALLRDPERDYYRQHPDEAVDEIRRLRDIAARAVDMTDEALHLAGQSELSEEERRLLVGAKKRLASLNQRSASQANAHRSKVFEKTLRDWVFGYVRANPYGAHTNRSLAELVHRMDWAVKNKEREPYDIDTLKGKVKPHLEDVLKELRPKH